MIEASLKTKHSANMKCIVPIVLLSISTIHVSGQVASLCRPNERFLSCGGCQPTCSNPRPICTAVCREGCYCPEGMVRDKDGECIELKACSPSSSENAEDTSEPRSKEACPKNEEYRFCEPCNRTCDNPNPICPAQCARGCFCIGELLRSKDGQCVKKEQCMETESSNYVKKPEKVKVACGLNEIYKECGNCEKTCSNPNPVCPAQCVRQCSCKDGYVKAPNGKCVTMDKCPKETCDDPNEEYACRYGCEMRCGGGGGRRCGLRPRACTFGCHCKLGYVREPITSRCVTPDKCDHN